MQDNVLKKLPAQTPVEVCRSLELETEPETAALFQEETSHQALLTRLIEGAHYTDAVRYLAHALPKREAVWWACLCVRAALEGGEDAEAPPPLAAAEAWVRQPTDENRRAAHAAAEAEGMASPASLAAMATFFSGGSLAPPDVDDVEPPGNVAGRLLTGAIILCAVTREPEKAADKYRSFLGKGIELAMGAPTKGAS